MAKTPKTKSPFDVLKWDGRKITKPGIYSGIGIDVYHSADICDGVSVSSSGLRKIFTESPAHFYADWAGNPERAEPKDATHFVLGRAVHMLVLGEPFFAKLFCIQPAEYADDKTGEMKPWNNNAKVCRAWNAERAKEGRSVLKNGDVENIKGMAKSIGHHPLVQAGALNGQIERSLFWKDKETGIWLKSRPDNIPGSSADMVDLKTTLSVLWPDLVRTISDYSYHAQGALIRMAAREVLGLTNVTFTLIFVEETRPWCTRVVTVKDSDLDRGDRQNRAALDTMAACLKSKHWPGPGGDREDAEYIELSEFSQKQIDDRLKHGVAE